MSQQSKRVRFDNAVVIFANLDMPDTYFGDPGTHKVTVAVDGVIQKKIDDALIVTGGPKGSSKIKDKIFSEYINVSKNVSNVRKFGSAALDVAYVACGRFDGYWQRELNYWDIAAGIIILKEAGGYVDFFDEDEKLPLKKNILASNSFIHEELRGLIKK